MSETNRPAKSGPSGPSGQMYFAFKTGTPRIDRVRLRASIEVWPGVRAVAPLISYIDDPYPPSSALPGLPDEHSPNALLYRVAVTPEADVQNILLRLREIPQIDSAYVKPTDSLPG